jgi:RNA polymerase sigma-70 factor (ECF subfamily)
MNELRDEEIVGAIRSGSVDAYAELIRRYQGEVWRVVTAFLRDRHEIEDLVQQVFIKAYFALDRFDTNRPFSHWIKEIARNEARQELRRFEREGRRLDFYEQHLLADGVDEAATARQTRLEHTLRRCREGLAGHVAAVMDQRYEHGFTFEEIATRLGRSVEATRQMLTRARVALRDCVQRLGRTNDAH